MSDEGRFDLQRAREQWAPDTYSCSQAADLPQSSVEAVTEKKGPSNREQIFLVECLQSSGGR